jgi:hypothetical protein
MGGVCIRPGERSNVDFLVMKPQLKSENNKTNICGAEALSRLDEFDAHRCNQNDDIDNAGQIQSWSTSETSRQSNDIIINRHSVDFENEEAVHQALLFTYGGANYRELGFLDDDMKTTWFNCASENDIVGTAKLLALGLSIDIKDKSGRTALHIATENGSRAIVDYLIRKGIDTKIQDKKGRTAYMIAISEGTLGMQKKLLVEAEPLSMEVEHIPLTRTVFSVFDDFQQVPPDFAIDASAGSLQCDVAQVLFC